MNTQDVAPKTAWILHVQLQHRLDPLGEGQLAK